MLLPDLKLFAKLCGATSFGDVFLPSEKEGRRGVNGAVHKILRDVLSGKPVTRKRIVILLRAFSDKAQIFGLPASSLPDASIDERYISAPPAKKTCFKKKSHSKVGMGYTKHCLTTLTVERRLICIAFWQHRNL